MGGMLDLLHRDNTRLRPWAGHHYSIPPDYPVLGVFLVLLLITFIDLVLRLVQNWT